MHRLQVRLSKPCHLPADRWESMQLARYTCSAAAHRLQHVYSMQRMVQLDGLAAQVASASSCLLRLTDLHTLVLGHQVPCTGHTSLSGAAECSQWYRQVCRAPGDAAARAATAKGLRVIQGTAHLMRQQGRFLHWCSCHRLQRQRTFQDNSIACALLQKYTKLLMHASASQLCSSKAQHEQRRHMQRMRMGGKEVCAHCLHAESLPATPSISTGIQAALCLPPFLKEWACSPAAAMLLVCSVGLW